MATNGTESSVHLMFKAFSDPTRLRILHMLRGGELCVCDIGEVLNASQPKVSRHLAYLRKAGLVASRKQGLWIYYSLPSAKNPLQRALVASLEQCSPLVAQLRYDAQKLTRQKKKSCC
jgi:ArsR family transcriptional regulator